MEQQEQKRRERHEQLPTGACENTWREEGAIPAFLQHWHTRFFLHMEGALLHVS